VSTLSKSPVRVAIQALVVGDKRLPLYAHKFSPKRYTQPQLFACLVLKTFFKADYRGITHLLQDHSDLRCVLRLRQVPHFTTLQKASRRLLRKRMARRLLSTTVRRFLKRRRRIKRAAFDSTGLDCGHRSSYYVRRRNGSAKRWQIVVYHHYAKLEVAVDCRTHLIVAALVGRGPRVDVDRFVPLFDATLQEVRVDAVLADAGYDSEPNHRHARERHGVRSFIPATAGRPTAKLPTGRYRRRMKQRLCKDYGKYGQRAQVETSFSMLKRRLGAAVHARKYWSQCRELFLRVLTYNLMLLYAAAGFLQSRPVPFFGQAGRISLMPGCFFGNCARSANLQANKMAGNLPNSCETGPAFAPSSATRISPS
jgi:Transposase DDE domain